MCPNGDWRASSVQYFVPFGSPPEVRDRKSIVDHCTHDLFITLASSRPTLYNRSKWASADLVVSDLGIFEAVHKLLSTSFARRCSSLSKGPLAAQSMTLGRELRCYDRWAFAEVDKDDNEDDGGEGAAMPGADAAVGHAVAGAQGPSSSAENNESQAWAKDNAKKRRLGMGFLRDDPLSFLIVARLVMGPMRAYLNKQFQRASDAWAFKELATVAYALQSGVVYQRTHRILEAAEWLDDEWFFQQLGALSMLAMWQITPPSFQTVTNRAHTFKTLSRMGCAFSKLLASRHQRGVYQTFRALNNPDVARQICDQRECMLDAWTSALRAIYPTLHESERLHVMASIAEHLKVVSLGTLPFADSRQADLCIPIRSL